MESSDDKDGESRMIGASYNGIGRDVPTNMSTFTFKDPSNGNGNEEDQGNIDSSDDNVLDVSIKTRDISGSTHSTSNTGHNMDTAGFTMSHGLSQGTGYDGDTTTGRLGSYKDTTSQYGCTRMRIAIYGGDKDQCPTILTQVQRSLTWACYILTVSECYNLSICIYDNTKPYENKYTEQRTCCYHNDRGVTTTLPF